MPKKKILFILKQRNTVWNPDDQYSAQLSSGLLNSVKFVQKMLADQFGDCDSHMSQVVDANSIDREVTLHKPRLVIIEALWVTPEKLAELAQLHPNVTWVVRLHSEVPFLANEGVAMDWLNRYTAIRTVRIAANSIRLSRELGYLLTHAVIHLPNCYDFHN